MKIRKSARLEKKRKMEQERNEKKKCKSTENSEEEREEELDDDPSLDDTPATVITPTASSSIPEPSKSKKHEEAPLLRALKSDQKHECLIALQELSEMLVVANEEDFIQSKILSSPNLVQILIGFLQPSPEIYDELDLGAELMLLSCRCLYNLVEVNPAASSTISHCRGVEVLVSKLLEIEYIDMAEIVLKVLERISIDYPSSILRANGLFACLQYLDFFGIHVQRTAVSTVANTCRSLPHLTTTPNSSSSGKDYGYDAFMQVSQVFEQILRLVTSNDEKIFDYAAKSLMRIADWCSKSPEKMNELFEGHVQSLLDCFDYHATKGPQTGVFLMVIHTMSKIVKNCVSLRDAFITNHNILGRMKELVVRDGGVVEFAVSRPTEQVLAILDFLSDSLPEYAFEGVWKIGSAVDSPAVLQYDPDALREYHREIFPLLFEIFMSSSLLSVLKKTVLCIAKVIQISPSSLLSSSLKKSSKFGKFLFQLISLHHTNNRDERLLVHAGLAITITVLEKCEGVFENRLAREGVFVELQKLISMAPVQGESDTADRTEVHDGFSALQELLRDDESGIGARLMGIRRAMGGSQGNNMSGLANERFRTQELVESIHSLANKLSLMVALDDLDRGGSAISKHLDSLVSEGKNGDSKAVLKALLGLEKIFSSTESDNSDSATNFEIFEGDLVSIMIDFLTTPSECDFDHTFPKFEQTTTWKISLKERILLFMEAFFSPSATGFGSLISHIHEHISRLEKFPIMTASNSDSSFMGRMETLMNIGMFAKQLRLTLSAADPDSVPDALKSVNIAVPAIASLKSVESFILSRSLNHRPSGLPSRSTNQEESLINVFSETDAPSEEDEDELDIANSPAITSATTEVAINLEKSASQSSSISKIPKATPSVSANLPAKRYVLFSYNGSHVSTDSTVFGSVYDQTSHEISPVWQKSHSFKFEILDKKPVVPRKFSRKANIVFTGDVCKEFYSEFRFSNDITEDKNLQNVLVLIGLLNSLNSKFTLNRTIQSQNPYFISPLMFVNNKLAAKLNRQLSQPLLCVSGVHPDWAWELLFNHGFLIPFETRLNFLRMTALGPARNMHHWLRVFKPTDGHGGPSLENVVRGERLKVRISRDAVFESMVKVINMEGHYKASLEVEFLNEVGSGLGPTLEFFTLVSKSIRVKKGLRLTPSATRILIWRDDDEAFGDYINPSNGVYPRPFHPTSLPSIGAFVAKAFLDSRQLDIQFSPIFLDQVFKESITVVDVNYGLAKLKSVNISLFNSLIHLQSEKVKDIEAMCLDFTLPGYPDIELIPNGSAKTVSKDNLKEYVELVVDFTVGCGVKTQVDAFRQGFDQIVPIHFFDCFALDEIMTIVGGEDDKSWIRDDLRDTIKADHGYDIGSRIITQFIDMLSEFSGEERRLFLSFCTGSPRLPIGGFKALNPPLTIVRKTVDKSVDVNKCLPSVMTCLNYLKIPEYSDPQFMKSAFLYAMKEGQNSFHLS